MGILSEDKGSRKRKRNKNVDESLDQSLDNKDEKIPQKDVDFLSPKQKPAKKRKKSGASDSFGEDSPKDKVKKSKASNDTEGDAKEKEKKSKISTKEQNSKEDKVEKDDATVTSILPKQMKSKEKRKKSSPVKTSETAEKTADEDESLRKKKKRKGGNASSFGVVDSQLLKESGGESLNADNTKTPHQSSSRINRAVDYLHSWKTDKKRWKFNKNFQSLLIKAIYNPVIISDDDFETCLLYFGECQGKARDKLKDDAMALINDDDHLAEPVDADMERRAREILQMLG